MKLTVTTFLSVDGVYQGPGGPTEDTSGGFSRGGWLVPLFDEATGQFMTEVFQKPGAFLLGRRTYQVFASYWPKVGGDLNDPVANPLNALPKYVISKTLASADWQKSIVLGGDLVAEVTRLKAMPGKELQVHGSGVLVRALIDKDLVDELRLLVFPVIVGEGKRLFPETGAATGLHLAESRQTPSGVSIQVYQPTGRPALGEVPPPDRP